MWPSSKEGRTRTSNTRRFPEIWALKGISFEIRAGETVGIVGSNGAGKSTLLKILSRITYPTEGHAQISGRVASLLEVGTGFHPELSGRENIYLNGAILGMSRAEIDERFQEIIEFAELEKFLDTPIKHYSSGMYVRLAFAVAAHLHPEILLVDEVLAVGDLQFQKKCLGKMEEAAGRGRTVIFVSHNLSAVSRLCNRCLLLEEGKLIMDGPSAEVIAKYTQMTISAEGQVSLENDPSKAMCLSRVAIQPPSGSATGLLEMAEPFTIQVEYDVNRIVTGAHVICFIHNAEGVNILGTGDADCYPERLQKREPGRYCGSVEIPASLLGEGWYYLTLSFSVPFVQVYSRYERVLSFHVQDSKSIRRQWHHHRWPGILGLELPWTMTRI